MAITRSGCETDRIIDGEGLIDEAGLSPGCRDDYLISTITDPDFATKVADLLGEKIRGRSQEALNALGNLQADRVKLLVEPDYEC